MFKRIPNEELRALSVRNEGVQELVLGPHDCHVRAPTSPHTKVDSRGLNLHGRSSTTQLEESNGEHLCDPEAGNNSDKTQQDTS